MNPDDITRVCEAADMIVCGYAFTKDMDGNVRVLNLREPHHALVISPNGEVLETSMDDVELSIVKEYWAKNQNLMEEMYA